MLVPDEVPPDAACGGYRRPVARLAQPPFLPPGSSGQWPHMTCRPQVPVTLDGRANRAGRIPPRCRCKARSRLLGVKGDATPEEAARAEESVTPQYASVVAVDHSPDGRHAVVLIEYKEPPHVERYAVLCQNTPRGWVEQGGGSAGGLTWIARARTVPLASRWRGDSRRRSHGTHRAGTSVIPGPTPVLGDTSALPLLEAASGRRAKPTRPAGV
jgi:hypothetical protein